MQALSRVVPENAIFATDVGVHHNWVVQLWKARRPRHLLQSWGFAAMGYATSGILGAKLAQPEMPGDRGRRRRLVPDDAAHPRHRRWSTTFPPCGSCGTTTATARSATCSSDSFKSGELATSFAKIDSRRAHDARLRDARALVRRRSRARRARRATSKARSTPRSRRTSRISSKSSSIARSGRSAPAPGCCRRSRTASRTSGSLPDSTSRAEKKFRRRSRAAGGPRWAASFAGGGGG